MPPTQNSSMLLPSGEDANPMRRRLPAEVITRKRRDVKVVEEKVVEEVRVDLKAAILLKPDARPKWLSKAFKMVEENKSQSSELYSIVTSRKFIGGLPGKIGRRLREIVFESIDIFSDKQQRFLKSEDWSLNALFAESERPDGDVELKEDDPSSDDDPAPPPDGRSNKEESKDPEETWVAAPAARGQTERHNREAALNEERAKRKKKEEEEQERWMEVQAEAANKKAVQQQEAKKRALEDEVDSSLMLLDTLGGSSRQGSSSAQEKDKDKDKDKRKSKKKSSREEPEERGRRGRGGLSRSRSVKARSRSRRRRRSKSKGGRRRSESGGRPKVDFNEALRRRLQEREASDTTRMAVVDPDHASRWATRGW